MPISGRSTLGPRSQMSLSAPSFHDPTRQAFVLVDELLAKNFAVLGSTGSGKSCGVALILSAVLAGHPQAHIVVLDPHNEYATAFGDLAEVVNVDNLQLPLWLLDFEEAAGVLIRGGTVQEQEAQAIILKDAITRARRHYASKGLAAASITVDTPAPFGVPDLLRFIDEAMGRLNNPDNSAPYLRLRTRLEIPAGRSEICLHVLRLARYPRYAVANRRPSAAHPGRTESLSPSSICRAFHRRSPMSWCL